MKPAHWVGFLCGLRKLLNQNFGLILFDPRQRRLTVGMVTDFVSSIHNLKTVF